VAFCIIHFKNQKSLIIIFTLIGQRMSNIDQRMKNDEDSIFSCLLPLLAGRAGEGKRTLNAEQSIQE
jgi:hypothetical protein